MHYDVVVVGSGSAGSPAAIAAAARAGASTLLIEKLPFLGGNTTAVLDTFYGFYIPGEVSRKVVAGIGDGVVAGLRSLGPVVDRPNSYGAGARRHLPCRASQGGVERMAEDAGVSVMLHSFLQDVTVEDGTVAEVIVATKAGLVAVSGDVFVDCSGEADLCHFAGFGYELAGEFEPAQTLTSTFRMVNVDHEKRRTGGKEGLHEMMAEGGECPGVASIMGSESGSEHGASGLNVSYHPPITPTRRRSSADSVPRDTAGDAPMRRARGPWRGGW